MKNSIMFDAFCIGCVFFGKMLNGVDIFFLITKIYLWWKQI